MPGKIGQQQNAKEVPHSTNGKRKKPKEHGQERAAKMPTRQSQNVAKKFRHQSFLTVFFLKKIPNIFIG